jgi:hypothetical protein
MDTINFMPDYKGLINAKCYYWLCLKLMNEKSFYNNKKTASKKRFIKNIVYALKKQ